MTSTRPSMPALLQDSMGRTYAHTHRGVRMHQAIHIHPVLCSGSAILQDSSRQAYASTHMDDGMHGVIHARPLAGQHEAKEMQTLTWIIACTGLSTSALFPLMATMACTTNTHNTCKHSHGDSHKE
eukprot:1161427-Pelagomonas_calceolata.AAC.7